MFKNKLKKDLYDGKTCIGTFISINSPDIVEVFGIAGFDFVIIDNEHGYMTPETSVGLIRAAELRGMTPIVRATENSETVILRSLDVGAHGIQVPQINDKEAAELAVKRSKYYPQGIRGVAMPRAGDYGLSPIFEYFKQENEETLVSVHCENVKGLENIDAIAATPGVDVIFFGPFDMSQSMGIPGQVEHQRIQEAAQIVLAACKKHGKIPGTFCGTPEAAKVRAAQGFRYIAIGMEVTLIGSYLRNVINIAKA